MKCTIQTPDGDCPNDARATCALPNAGLVHACAAHLGLLAVEHGQRLSVYTLGAEPVRGDEWEGGRE